MNGKKLTIILTVLLLIGLFFYGGLHRFLTLASLKDNQQLLMDYNARHRLMMVAGFMALYIVQTTLSLPGAAVLSLAAGALFGAVAGTLYAVVAATIGACLAFMVTRYLLRDAVLNRFGSRLAGLNQELETRGVNYLLFLRLVPLFPFFLINLAAGITALPLRTFFIGTLCGIIPGAFVFVNAGASLATISSLADVASARVLGSFALLGLFAVVPVLYSKLQSRRKTGDQ